MYVQQGTIDVSFGEIIVASGIRSSKLFTLNNIQYIVYSTNTQINTQIKITKVDGTETQIIYTGMRLSIHHVDVLSSTQIAILGKNETTSQGFYTTTTLSSGSFSSVSPTFEHQSYLKSFSTIKLVLKDNNEIASISPNNALFTITSVDDNKLYKDAIYVPGVDHLYLIFENFNPTTKYLYTQVIKVTSASTANPVVQSPQDTIDTSKNTIYMDSSLINGQPHMILSSQGTITPTQVSSSFSFQLQDNIIKLINLSTSSVYKSYTLNNVFIDNVTIVEHEESKYTLVGYGYQNSDVPLKYISIPLNSSEDIDITVEGKGYHFETSTLTNYFLTPYGKVDAIKDPSTNDIYLITEATTGNNTTVSLIATKFNYPPSLAELLETIVDGTTIQIVNEYGEYIEVKARKPDPSGNIAVQDLTGVTNLSYSDLPSTMIILYANFPDTYIQTGKTSITSFYIKYFHTNGLLHDFNATTLTSTITLSTPIFNTLDWYDKDVSSSQYVLIDSAEKESDNVSFIFTITKNGQTVINGVSIFSNGGSGSIGSDPHVFTLFGKKYDMKTPSSRKWYSIFKKDKLNIEGHFTGYKSGIYFDTVKIKNKDQNIVIDFNSKKIKNQSKYLIEEKTSIQDLKYENLTGDKKYEKIFEPGTMTKIHIPDERTPLNLFVDFKTRYLHFRFPSIMPMEQECSGLLVRKEN
jgi:hypothetical protein